MKRSDFEYALPPECIAQQPLQPRDASKLLWLDRATGRRRHCVFRELPALLQPGDLLVLNDTRVLPAKFSCRRRTGARLEGLFLHAVDAACWEVLLKNAQRCRPGERLAFEAEGFGLELLGNLGRGRWRVRPISLESPDSSGPETMLRQVGVAPLPPYIRREDRRQDSEDLQRYQTVYARQPGAVAAPTAGLHFTETVLDRLADRGIERVAVTLHVGLGTFAPVTAENLREHDMHREGFFLSAASSATIRAARAAGRRVVAVGTTSVRVLEAAARQGGGELSPEGLAGSTDLFLYPPAAFDVVDALITNFHLPRSTLLMLVAAFCDPGGTAGREMILDAYAYAIDHHYRFYSYGDAMLIT